MNEIIRKIDDLIFEAHRQWTDFEEDRKHCSWDDYSMFIREVVEEKLKEIIQAEQKEPKTNGDLIREMNNEELANWIFEEIESTEWDEDGNNNYEDDIAEWLDEVVSERN